MILRAALATSPLSIMPLLRRSGRGKGLLPQAQRRGKVASPSALRASISPHAPGDIRLIAITFRIGIVIATAFVGAAAGYAQVETTDPGIVSGTLARIKTTGTVRLGYRDASIPFSYLDRSGRPIGYSIDICNAIVEEIGRLLDREDLKVDFVKVTSQTRLQPIVNGAIDLECGSTTNNLERRKLVDFSPMIFVSGTKVSWFLSRPSGATFAI
jgi:ABC-type amino acid transport substrate-binding protein